MAARLMLKRSDLYAYQERAVEFDKNIGNGMKFMDMGLGKTVSVLTAYNDMRNTFDARRLLVSAPLRVARKVWSDEVNSWEHLKHLRVSRIVGTPEQRMAALNADADVYTINREQLVWLEDKFIQGRKQLRRWPFDMIVHDESQSYKNCSSMRYKAARCLSRLAERVICMTGTPAPNGYIDLWAQYFLLDRGARLGHGIGNFRERWFDCIQTDDRPKWLPRDGAKEEIRKAVADITLSMRAEDYLELPEVKHNFVRVALDPKAEAKYRRLEKQMIIEFDGRAYSMANKGALYTKLMQLANGAIYENTSTWHEIHMAKIDGLIELLDCIPGKAIVAYAFQHDMARVGKAMHEYCKATGRKGTLLRTDAQFAAWARGEYDYGLLHPASAGHGLNDVYKSGCKDLIWFGGTNNLELYQQLNARLIGGHRRGLNMVIHHLICEDTIDVKLIGVIDFKDADQDALTRAMADYVQEIQ
jgi:hypothetical protein